MWTRPLSDSYFHVFSRDLHTFLCELDMERNWPFLTCEWKCPHNTFTFPHVDHRCSHISFYNRSNFVSLKYKCQKKCLCTPSWSF